MAKKIISKNNIFKMAEDFKKHVEDHQTAPHKFTYDNVEYYTKDMTYIFCYGLYHLKSNCEVPDNINWCNRAHGDKIQEKIVLDDVMKQVLNCFNHINKHHQVPDNVTTIKSKKKVNVDLFTYCLSKVLVYYKQNGKLPTSCEYNYRVLEVPFITLEAIVNIAGKVKESVETDYKVPDEIDGLRNGQFTYLMCEIIANRKPPLELVSVKTAPKPSGTDIAQNIYKSKYIELANNLIKFVDKYNELPNHLNFEGKQITKQLYQYMFAKVLDYYYWNKELPAYVYVNNNALIKPQPKPVVKAKSYSEEVFDYFSSKFGRPDSIDDALEKIQGRGYGYYYDDVYSNKQSIDRMRNGQGVNCTDACHVFWHIGKALGYDVIAIHVICRGGDGHVRLQFYKSQYGWFNRDPAAVLDGECVECIWCGNGEYRATNPQWFLNNVNR